MNESRLRAAKPPRQISAMPKRRQPYARSVLAGKDRAAPGASSDRSSTVAHGPVGSTPIHVAQMRGCPPGQYADPPASDYLLQVAEGGQGPSRGDMGAGPFTTVWRRGIMLLSMPDAPVRHDAHCEFDLSALSLPPSLFEEAWNGLGHADRPLDTGPLHLQAFSEPFVFELALRIAGEAADDNPGGTLYVDSLSYALAAELLRLAGEIEPPQDAARPLLPEALGEVTTVMEDRLSERVGISELSDLLDMNVYGFSRAFRAATGMSPHQYLTNLRINRVKTLLDGTDEPLAAIAIDCGFSSQSHMTAAFTKHVGVPPGAWRRGRR
ncbi:MAG: AraC family transcriptional regulator [Pseudomonadota bacterium]